MRYIILLLILFFSTFAWSQEEHHLVEQWNHCIKSSDYQTNGKKFSKYISYCENEHAFRLFHDNWEILCIKSDYSQSVDENGYFVEKFCNAADDVMLKAQYLVTITHSKPATIMINFTIGDGGYWFIKTNDLPEVIIKENKQ